MRWTALGFARFKAFHSGTISLRLRPETSGGSVTMACRYEWADGCRDVVGDADAQVPNAAAHLQARG
ncbi:hypothetical protein VS28_18700 [Vibrio cholerae O1 biovar El Tor]|nr:hypothetical protein VS28_18700 [Vibrio cholerae O1 biovar El Tor]